MDLSALSVYDNVDTPKKLSKSRMYNKLNDLVNVNIDFELRIFCPLCIKSFSFKFSLFEHLKTFHCTFLTRANNQTLKINECPFCGARFYGKHLIAKHVLHYHSKVIKALFVNKNKLLCFFCNVELNGGYDSVVNHFEQSHFLNFQEEFSKMFSDDRTQEMSMSELINSTLEGKDPHSSNWEDVCIKTGKHPKNDLGIQKLNEVNQINYYDFGNLKEQLEEIKDFKSIRDPNVNLFNKSILKDIKNSNMPQKSARRVLKFDFPSNIECNSMLERNFSALKKPKFDEFSLICDDNNRPNFIFKSNETFCEKPQHFSTPISRFLDMPRAENKKKTTIYCKSNFKSNISEKIVNKFDFQCGKCKLLFKENLDLVSHVKNKHRMFGLSAFQPCYHCAICNARFYKNCYLRKHHNLHKPY